MAKKYDSQAEYKRYCAEIDLYDREFESWLQRSKKITKLYKDADNKRGTRKRFNILWSNVQTMKPALYARTPVPEIKRRFKDPDPVGKWAAEILERCIDYTVEETRFDDRMEAVVDDRLLGGRGVLWPRYKPIMGAMDGPPDPITNEPDEEIAYECTKIDYVNPEDFGHNVARTWPEVEMVWRRVYMTREKLVNRFGEIGQKIPLDYSPKGLKDESLGEVMKRAAIYEIWDRGKGKICFLSKGHPDLIETNDDAMGLEGMFPCPKPLYATLTNDSLVPAPDYALYQTQAQDIEDLTARITKLKKALKVAGVYDASAPELARLLNEGYENKLLPVDEWAAFAEKGGIQGAVVFLPIKEIADVLLALYEARERAKQDLYELTGIADIIRGNSDPNETATAQQIKGRFAVLRISDQQSDVQEFARDVYRIVGEIIAEHYQLDTIKMISGVQLLHESEKVAAQQAMMRAEAIAKQTGQEPQNPIPDDVQKLMNEPTWEEVHALLSHDTLRNFRIDIETDSTIRTDEEADRAERTEFLNVVGGFLQQAIAASAQEPALGPLMAELIRFGIRGHRSARQLEGAFDEAIKKMEEPKPPQPNPDMMKIEAEKEIAAMKVESQERLEQFKTESTERIAQLESGLRESENERSAELKAQVERDKQQAQHQENLATAEIEEIRSQREAERLERIEIHKAELQAANDRQKILTQAEAQVDVEQIKADLRREEMCHQTALKEKEAASQKEARDHEEKKRKEDAENENRRNDNSATKIAEVRELIKEIKKLKEAS